MTPWAQAKYNAAKPGIGPRAQPLGNDPIMVCDPIGYPRIGFYNDYPHGDQWPRRTWLIAVLRLFSTWHRIDLMDGRSLPENPETDLVRLLDRALGTANTLIKLLKCTGFNDQSWLDNDGHPHSDQMKLEERFTRVDHDTMESKMTLTDPVAYTAPWVSDVEVWKLKPKQGMREDLCAPSDEAKYKDEVREPAAAKK